MAEMRQVQDFAVPAERLWALAGRWDHFEAIAGEVVRRCAITEGGRARRLWLDEGIVIDEPLLEFDHAARTLVWGIGAVRGLDLPLEPTTFRARFTVREGSAGDSCRFEIAWTYDLKPGREAEGLALLDDYFRICFAGARQALGLAPASTS